MEELVLRVRTLFNDMLSMPDTTDSRKFFSQISEAVFSIDCNINLLQYFLLLFWNCRERMGACG